MSIMFLKLPPAWVLTLMFSLGLTVSPRTTAQNPHTHGLAKLTLAIEGNVVALHLESPAANLVGFETMATSTEEINAAQNTKKVLMDVPSLFSFVGGTCKPNKVQADMSGVLIESIASQGSHQSHHGGSHKQSHTDKHHDHAHEAPGHAKQDLKKQGHEKQGQQDPGRTHSTEKNSHKEVHSHDHSDLNKPGHDEPKTLHSTTTAHSTTHSEIQAQYRFKCDAPENLTSIKVKLFKLFPGIEQLEVMWITTVKQGASTLSSSNDVVVLK